MTFPLISHLRQTLSAWWSRFDPVATIKHAVDTLNSFGLTETHIEDIAGVVVTLKDESMDGLAKAAKAAEVISGWSGDKALPSQAMDALHVVITLVHLVSKLSGKL